MKKTYIAWYKVFDGFQFQLRTYNHEAIVTSEVYKQKASMLKGISIVQNGKIQEVKQVTKRDHEDFDIND